MEEKLKDLIQNLEMFKLKATEKEIREIVRLGIKEKLRDLLKNKSEVLHVGKTNILLATSITPQLLKELGLEIENYLVKNT